MGEVFAGRYELVDHIGDGGMGSVWRVWDRREERHLAAKILRQSDSGSLLRFMREQAMRIHDEHVCTPLGWAGEDDRVLYTMPLVRGGSVQALLGDHGALPVEWTGELMRQLFVALEAVHAAGVVHRDVKPANLLLEATGTDRPWLRLTDFGISIASGSPRLTGTDAVIGTPGYLAPEVFAGAEPAYAQDIYAAGRVGLEMMSGRRLEPVGDLESLRPADAASSAVFDVLAACASPSVRERPTTAALAREMLEAVAPPWSPTGGVEVFELIGETPGSLDVEQDSSGTKPMPRSIQATEQTRSATTALGSSGAAAAPAPDTPLPRTRGVAGQGDQDVAASTPTPEGGRDSVVSAPARGRGWIVPVVLALVAVIGFTVLWLNPGGSSGGRGGTPGGTVPTRVLDSPCTVGEADTDAVSANGTALRCTRQSNGSYAWVRVD